MVGADVGALDGCIKFIGFGYALVKDGFKIIERGISRCGRKAQPHRARSLAGDPAAIPDGSLGTLTGWIDDILFTADHMTVKAIFDIIAGVWPTEQPLGIGVVFREQQSGPVVHLPSVGIEKIVAGSRMGQVHPRNAFRSTLSVSVPAVPGHHPWDLPRSPRSRCFETRSLAGYPKGLPAGRGYGR